MPRPLTVGLISDTHNLLRPQALQALAGCDHLIHAGDICEPAVLEGLRELAPLTAVRGNNDRGAWAEALPEQARVELASVRLLVIHDIADLRGAVNADVVIHGHSHRPGQVMRSGVLYVNPGSAGPRRFRLPIAIARLRLDAGVVDVEIIYLEAA